MRVLNCLVTQHDYALVLLAAIMCLVGSYVTMSLVQRSLAESRKARQHWCFLSGITGGASVWATHFIAMIGYQPGVPIALNGSLTVASALVAVIGLWMGITFATIRNNVAGMLLGGLVIGLAISAMHYLGMFAYRAEGIVRWLPGYVVASMALSILFAVLTINRLRKDSPHSLVIATGLFVLAIVSLHFIGMAAFTITPLNGVSAAEQGDQFVALAGSIALVAMLIVGMGLSMQRVDFRTRERSEDQLRHIALHDPLTGLANRRHFNERLQAECAALGGENSPSFALLMVDLDRFKPVNDTLGHPVGDKVLEKVAERLRRSVRGGDLVARIGGDEFAIIVCNVDRTSMALQMADRVVELLSRPFMVDGEMAELGASVGIAMAPIDGSEADILLVRADQALYSAKREGRGRACQFDQEQSEAMQRRRIFEMDLRRACMREDFHVVYQPVKNTITGKFTGAEALIRWDCPTRGAVPPAEFIPVAEEMGLIVKIGAAVLRQACLDAAGWAKDYSVSVNLSPVQLLDPRLPQIVANALADSGLEAHRLELEITETALVGNDEHALECLKKLCKIGVSISLDDFGTGYSSLSYLHRFPIDRIKIDQSFVQQLPDDESSASIVRAIAQLGCNLKMKITAEGIETSDQLSAISDYGCDTVQGFLIGRPIVAERIGKLFLDLKKQEAA